jgi:PAS domain S-box-containing protein
MERAALNAEIITRFGLLPNFFCTAAAAPGLIDDLWGFAMSAYLDNPLPSLFKERLFVYLSRFCAIRYCITRHVGFLIGKGHPAGDRAAIPETVEQVLQLLKRPVPDVVNMDEVYGRLNGFSGPTPIPEAGTEAEGDLFDALAIMFVEPRKSGKARVAIKHVLGETLFELLTAYLAFIRTAHYWTETHPELVCEADMIEMMEKHPELGDLLLDTKEAERIQSGEMLRRALNESEEKYRTIFNSIDEGFALCEAVLNEDGQAVDIRLLEVNPSFEMAVGTTRNKAKPGTLRQAIPAADREWIRALSRAAINRETIHFEKQLTPDRWFSGCASPTGETGTMQFVLIVSNVTERKRLEQQKEDFLSIASHELKTPVTSIKAYGQLLESGLKERGEQENVWLAEKMNAQVNRLNGLISDLLDTTKITEGQLLLEYESFELIQLIGLIAEEMQQLSPKHVLVVTCENSIRVKADHKRIEQVITNLLSNAIKYSPDGGRVIVSCQSLETEVKITFEDEGIGIPGDAKEKIFERFFRLKHDRSNTLPGMGLGLYICAGIVHRHGGVIGVESNPRGGSIFYFTLPYGEVSAQNF